jgi:hypothetical protein|uniref:Uncharacterized protein n=1 Tax=Siphoviridae sp. cteLh2 TaxID=2825590 RepID=A0A8S5U5S7_9CAUD|nr:hypothetical protein [uncultured Lachnoclostridium sp.]DAF89810.1 MAG TPA: hypothetical protein [Siphoviridae sp. cteLh2]
MSKGNKQELLDYCYEHEHNFKADLMCVGEDYEEQFACLLFLIKEGDITSFEQLKEYGMDY